MRRHFDLLRIYIKCKLLDCLRGLLLRFQFHIACDFVVVDDLDPFDYPFWIFRGNQSTKVENSLIHEEHI
jgi:hypothetical protein